MDSRYQLAMSPALLLSLFFQSCVPCGDTRIVSEECRLDECAATCGLITDALSCCIDEHGRGLTGESDIAAMTSECADASCKPADFLSEAAAVCAAQVHGLPEGIGPCDGYFDGEDWTIQLATSTCADTTGARVDYVKVDGRTGDLTDTGYSDDVECI